MEWFNIVLLIALGGLVVLWAISMASLLAAIKLEARRFAEAAMSKPMAKPDLISPQSPLPHENPRLHQERDPAQQRTGRGRVHPSTGRPGYNHPVMESSTGSSRTPRPLEREAEPGWPEPTFRLRRH